MTEFVKVAKLSDLLSGKRLWVEFAEEMVILFNLDGQFYGIADLCTHDDGPLEDGELDGHAIECPRHGARFDIRTGKALCLPATAPIPTYIVKVEGEDIFIGSPAT